MAAQTSYLDTVLSNPSREELMLECPALQLLCYQHVVAAIMAGRTPLPDPLARRTLSTTSGHSGSSRNRVVGSDGVAELLAMRSCAQLLDRVLSPAKFKDRGAYWESMRRTLEAAWTPTVAPPKLKASFAATEADNDGDGNAAAAADAAQRLLASVKGEPHFLFPKGSAAGLPLLSNSLQNTVESSKRLMRSVTTCALSGSTSALQDRQHQALSSIIQFARLVPSVAAGAEGEVTSEGLNFCMMSLQQQWWVMVSGAMDRIYALTQSLPQPQRPTPPQLWQLLAVLAVLDTTAYMYAFPNKEVDPLGYQLIARLSEVGLTYLVRAIDGTPCFAVSPHFHHALESSATTPICTSTVLGTGATGSSAGCYRREDTDTIITETNFRLYAYTCNEDLLRILDQFAIREEKVDNMLVCYRLTRSSFTAALRKGITAAQVLTFLSLRAHPSMLHWCGEDAHGTSPTTSVGASNDSNGVASRALAVPQSVCDQVLMWESECSRVTFTKGVVLLRNMSDSQRETLAAFLREIGHSDALVHEEPGFVVLREEAYNRFLADIVPEGNVTD